MSFLEFYVSVYIMFQISPSALLSMQAMVHAFSQEGKSSKASHVTSTENSNNFLLTMSGEIYGQLWDRLKHRWWWQHEHKLEH